MKIMFKNNIVLSIISSFIILFYFSNSIQAKDAKFYLSQIDSKQDVKEVSININSESLINAAQSNVYFDNKNIEIVSISISDSIFNLWIKKPYFDNKNGVIKFSGGVIGGFKGDGELFKVKFKSKDNKDIKFIFKKNFILAHNGKGTNLIKKSEMTALELKTKIITKK